MSDVLTELRTLSYNLSQGKNMKLEKYHELKAQVEVLDELGVTIEDESHMNSIAEENGQIIPTEMIGLQHKIKV